MTKTSRKPKKKKYPKTEVYIGSDQDLYELERHAVLSGAGSISALVRHYNNKLKPQYRNQFTLLEKAILEQTQNGNNELAGLFKDLQQEFSGLKIETVKLALASLTNRGHLIQAIRGGKSNSARGGALHVWFPKDHRLGSEFSIARLQNFYEDND